MSRETHIIFEQIRSSGCLSYVLGCAQEKSFASLLTPRSIKLTTTVCQFFGAKLLNSDTHSHADENLR